jgi:hypothetical protein
MGLEVTCPNGHILRLSEKYAGKSVRCPRCQKVLEIPTPEDIGGIVEDAVLVAPRPEQEQDDDDEAERKAERRRQRRERLNQVRVGVTLHLIKIVAMLLSILIVAALVGVAGGMKSERMLRVTFLFGNIGRIAISALGIVGSVLCLSVPRASGVRNMIVVSLCLDLAAAALNGVLLIVPVAELVGLVVYVSNLLLSMGSWLTFMFFLKGLAAYLRKRHLEDDALAVIKFGLILWVLGILSPIAAGVLAPVLGCIGLLLFLGLGIAFLIMGIIFLIKYVSLLLALRRVL